MLRNAWGSKLLALRGVTVGGAGVIFVKTSVTYFLNSPNVKYNSKIVCRCRSLNRLIHKGVGGINGFGPIRCFDISRKACLFCDCPHGTCLVGVVVDHVPRKHRHGVNLCSRRSVKTKDPCLLRRHCDLPPRHHNIVVICALSRGVAC